MRWLRIRAGSRARERIAACGLRAEDVAAVPAAAGGPKGLALLALDGWIFGHWLPAAAPRERWLIGASIGAWRMAAAAQRQPETALARLGAAYVGMQRYTARPTPAEVSDTCVRLLRAFVGDATAFAAARRPGYRVAVVTARARAGLAGACGKQRVRAAFGRAALDNALARTRLARHLQRVLFVAGDGDRSPDPAGHDRVGGAGASDREAGGSGSGRVAAPWPRDAFDSVSIPLDAGNLDAALMASGSIPLVMQPVCDPPGAPAGEYWDGGLIDYHLYWDWRALDGLVLYPHFGPAVTAGWLDKHLPWRRHGEPRVDGAGRWVDNLVLLYPSAELLARLPLGKLPDRKDFHRYGTDHAARESAWRQAMAECARLAEDLAAFVERPDPKLIEAFPSRSWHSRAVRKIPGANP